MANSGNNVSQSLVEAARYALLRRVAPAIRHRMVGKLHPIGLIAETAERRIRAGAPELEHVRESIAKINGLSRSAMQSFASLITWLAPEDGATTTIGDGIAECLDLLRTEFDLRGFSIESEVGACDACVSLAAVRNVLTASLIAITDSVPGPANLSLSAQVSNKHVLFSILARPAEAVAGIASGGAYRPLDWSDVQALAQAEAVKLTRRGERVDLRYPIGGVADRDTHPR